MPRSSPRSPCPDSRCPALGQLSAPHPPWPSPPLLPPKAASKLSVIPARSCIQLVIVANATEIISTSSPSLAELSGPGRSGWSCRKRSEVGWAVGGSRWPPPQDICCSYSSQVSRQLPRRTSSRVPPRKGKEKERLGRTLGLLLFLKGLHSEGAGGSLTHCQDQPCGNEDL